MSRGASSVLDRASSALNKSNSSFIGRKSLLDSETSDDAAELNRFLSGLSQKTKGRSQTTPKHTRAVPAGLSDISISSDEEFKNTKITPTAGPSTSGNKFLKSAKSASGQANSKSTAVASYSKSLPTATISGKSALTITGQSPALLRLSEQTQRFMSKSNASIGSSLLNKSKSLNISEDSTIISEGSDSVGAKGSKFLKSKQPQLAPAIESSARHRKTPIPAHSLRTSTEDDSDMAAYIQQLSPSASEVSDDGEISPKPASQHQMKKAVPDVKHIPVKDDSSFATETFSDGSMVVSNRRTPDSSGSEIATDSDGPIGGNVMDIDALSFEPTITSKLVENVELSKSKSAKDKSKLIKTSVAGAKTKVITKDNKKPPQSSLFSSLGLMSVDDLLPADESSVQTVSPVNSARSIRTESSSIKSYKKSDKSRGYSSESSIHTYKESVKTTSIASEIRTHSTTKQDSYESDFDDTLRETESIHTDDGSSASRRSRPRSSISSRSSRSKTRSLSRSSSRSRSLSYSRSSYTDTYTSRSRSHSLSRSPSRSRSSSERLSRSLTPSYTTSFDDNTESHKGESLEVSKTGDVVLKPVIPCVDMGVQTGLDLDEMILKYYWTSDQAIPRVSTGIPTDEVLRDPPKVAKMAVSNEALEVFTTYNPAILALNDMMRQQVELSKQFLSMQKEMHSNLMNSIERQHIYTTLEDTKQYIESKRKPKLTFEEALTLVKEEMGL